MRSGVEQTSQIKALCLDRTHGVTRVEAELVCASMGQGQGMPAIESQSHSQTPAPVALEHSLVGLIPRSIAGWCVDTFLMALTPATEGGIWLLSASTIGAKMRGLQQDDHGGGLGGSMGVRSIGRGGG